VQRRRERRLLGLLAGLLVVLLLCCTFFLLRIRSLGSDVDDLAKAARAAAHLTGAQARLKQLRAEVRALADDVASPSPKAEVQMVAVGTEGTILTSVDGISWTRQSLGDTKFIYDVEWNGSVWMAVGGDGGGNSGACGEAYSSTDGYNWTVHAMGCPDMLQGVGWNGSQWVGVGWYGQIHTSPDGVNWTLTQSGGSSAQWLWEVEWDDASGQWYAVGNAGTVRSSSNGTNWANVGGPGNDDLRGLTTGGSNWIVVGDNGTLARSPVGGGAWSSVSPGVGTLIHDVLFNGSQYVAVGEVAGPSSLVLTSGNGTQWTNQAISTTNTLRGLTWTNGLWIAVGDAHVIFTSPDGLQWTERTPPGTKHDLYQVASK
jgi:hypothetical protein